MKTLTQMTVQELHAEKELWETKLHKIPHSQRYIGKRFAIVSHIIIIQNELDRRA